MSSLRTVRRLKKLGSDILIPDIKALIKAADSNINSDDLFSYKQNISKDKRRRLVGDIKKWSSIAVLLAICMFIGAVNISPSFGKYMSRVPGIGTLAEAVKFKIYSFGKNSDPENRHVTSGTPDSNKNASKSYNRIGSNGFIDVSYEYGLNSFEDAIAKSYDILDFTVLEWLREDSKGMPKTFFKVKINKCYKNTIEDGEEAVLRQDGNSHSIMRGFPLFKIGDRILAFVNYNEENCYYWLINDDLYIYDYVEFENRSYWLKRGEINFPDISDFKLNSEITKSIIELAKKNDPILTETINKDGRKAYTQAFDFNRLSAEIEKRLQEQ